MPGEGPNHNIAYGTTDTGLDGIPGTRNYEDKPLGKLYYDIQERYIKPIIKYVWRYTISRFPSSYVLKYEPGAQDFLQKSLTENEASLRIQTYVRMRQVNVAWISRKSWVFDSDGDVIMIDI